MGLAKEGVVTVTQDVILDAAYVSLVSKETERDVSVRKVDIYLLYTY